MEHLLIDTMIEKVSSQEKRLDKTEKTLTVIEEKLSGISDQSSNFKQLAELVRQIQNGMKQIVWPVEKMNELSLRLESNNDLLSNPVKPKQIVVHSAGKLAWVIVSLVFVIILLVTGLINTVNKLNQYQTNDILWRYVKATNKSQNLEYLQSVENLYLNDPEKMKSLVEEAELHQKQLAESKAQNRGQVSRDSIPSPKKAKNKIKRSE